jgi:predicted nucleic-acid-binding protein
MAVESIDTNVLLRLYLNDVHEQFVQAKKLLETPNVRYHVADMSISEMVFVLERQKKLPRHIVAEIVSDILSKENLNCNRTLFNRVLPLYLRAPKLSFVDCCLDQYAALNEAVPLWTFDRKLARQSDVAKEIM